jgi:hypothetical protein
VNEVPVGNLLDSRGLMLDIDAEDFLVSAVLIAAIMVPGDDQPRIAIGSTDGMGSIEQTGLLAAANTINAAGWMEAIRVDGDDD